MTDWTLASAFLLLALLWIVTAVHEAGHALAIRLKGGEVEGVQVGRGPSLGIPLPGIGRLLLGVLPVGGGIRYRGVPPGTGAAAVAAAGPAANLLLAALLLPTAASVGRWVWLAPGAVVEFLTQGRAWTLLHGTRVLTESVRGGGPAEWTLALGALSAIWATLNLIPLPALPVLRRRPGAPVRPRTRGTDGWEVLAGLVAGLRGAAGRGSEGDTEEAP